MFLRNIGFGEFGILLRKSNSTRFYRKVSSCRSLWNICCDSKCM